MIWFSCVQCGRRHQRPEEAAGTLVFCECGYGNRVPWESTAPEEPPPPPPRRRPAEAYPAEEDPPRRRPAEAHPGEEELPPRTRRRRGESDDYRRRDRSRCLQHPDAPVEQTCEACGEGFCAACVVPLQGQTLCGPCKNYRVHTQNLPPSPSAMAILCLVLGLVGGPFALCLTPSVLTAGGPVNGVVALIGILGFAVLVATFVFGALALLKTESNPRIQGQSLAITGMVSALVSLIFIFCSWVLAHHRTW
jgi:hypothetical protein